METYNFIDMNLIQPFQPPLLMTSTMELPYGTFLCRAGDIEQSLQGELLKVKNGVTPEVIWEANPAPKAK